MATNFTLIGLSWIFLISCERVQMKPGIFAKLEGAKLSLNQMPAMVRGDSDYMVEFAVANSDTTRAVGIAAYLQVDESKSSDQHNPARQLVAKLPPDAHEFAWHTPAQDLGKAKLVLQLQDTRGNSDLQSSQDFEVRQHSPRLSIQTIMPTSLRRAPCTGSECGKRISLEATADGTTATLYGSCEKGLEILVTEAGTKQEPQRLACGLGTWSLKKPSRASIRTDYRISQTDPVLHESAIEISLAGPGVPTTTTSTTTTTTTTNPAGGGPTTTTPTSTGISTTTTIVQTQACQFPYWPLPATTPNTAVRCTGFDSTDAAANLNLSIPNPGPIDLVTVGYPPAIKTFVGRYLDSQAVRDYQFTFRTARAGLVRFAPEKNRIYMLIGSSLFAYNLNTFFDRLSTGEALVPAIQYPAILPTNTRSFSAAPEIFLRYDSFFYAEYISPWIVSYPDGQDRLFDFDWDDRGFVYPAYSLFGWGALRDDVATYTENEANSSVNDAFAGGPTLRSRMMPSVFQSRNVSPTHILAISTSTGQHFVVACSESSLSSVVYPLSSVGPSASTLIPSTLPVSFTDHAKAGGNRVALLNQSAQVAIYSNDTLVAGGSPIRTFSMPGGSFYGLDTDGTNFYATGMISPFPGPDETLPARSAVIAVINPAGSDYEMHLYPLRDSSQPVTYGIPPKLRFGSGYLTVFGGDINAGGWNVRLFKVDHLIPTEISLGGYVAKYYGGGAPNGFASPTPSYIGAWDAVIYKSGAKTYLFLAMKGLGDVYELQDGN